MAPVAFVVDVLSPVLLTSHVTLSLLLQTCILPLPSCLLVRGTLELLEFSEAVFGLEAGMDLGRAAFAGFPRSWLRARACTKWKSEV